MGLVVMGPDSIITRASCHHNNTFRVLAVSSTVHPLQISKIRVCVRLTFIVYIVLLDDDSSGFILYIFDFQPHKGNRTCYTMTSDFISMQHIYSMNVLELLCCVCFNCIMALVSLCLTGF